MQADQYGRDNFESFVRKEFRTKAKSFAPESLEFDSFNGQEQDSSSHLLFHGRTDEARTSYEKALTLTQ